MSNDTFQNISHLSVEFFPKMKEVTYSIPHRSSPTFSDEISKVDSPKDVRFFIRVVGNFEWAEIIAGGRWIGR